MNKPFHLELTSEEKSYLKDLARKSIANRLFPPPKALPGPVSENMAGEYGAFVTLTIDGKLRGCIGNIHCQQPLYRTIAEMAQAAAFQDPRFCELTAEEFGRIHVEISILGPVEPLDDVSRIEVGRHGLIVRRGMHSGLLLPQVAREYGWDKETFLAQTCCKAGLPPTAWQQKKTEIFWFEAEVF